MPTPVVQEAQEPEGRMWRGCSTRRAKQAPGCGFPFLEAFLGMRELGEIWEWLHIQTNETSERKREKI